MGNSMTTGLTSQQAAEQLKKHGANALPEPDPRTLAELFISQFHNPLIYILVAALFIDQLGCLVLFLL